MRQAAIDALRTCYDTETITMDNGDEYIHYGDTVGEIEQLPPIQPEPKRGKWIIKDDTERFIAQCNCCRYIEDSRRIKNFCPNCGAKMEVTNGN